jgi:hypothetical protein
MPRRTAIAKADLAMADYRSTTKQRGLPERLQYLHILNLWVGVDLQQPSHST